MIAEKKIARTELLEHMIEAQKNIIQDKKNMIKKNAGCDIITKPLQEGVDKAEYAMSMLQDWLKFVQSC